MTGRTVRFVFKPIPESSAYILRMSHCFYMIRIDARWIAANVIKAQPLWNGASIEFVGCPMGIDEAINKPEFAVSPPIV